MNKRLIKKISKNSAIYEVYFRSTDFGYVIMPKKADHYAWYFTKWNDRVNSKRKCKYGFDLYKNI